MTMLRMRVVMAAILAGAGPGCFKELPDVSGDSEATTSGATVEPTGGATSSSSAATEIRDSDVDEATTGTVPTPAEGLFACLAASCAAWTLPDCGQGCALDEAGTCALALLRDRASARVDVRACGDGCVRTALVIRGAGTDAAVRQSAREEGEALVDLGGFERCTLREPGFFAECLAQPTAGCVDPTQWFMSCADSPPTCGE